MTPSQLEPSAHAPCSSTMVGLGPPPLAAVAKAAPAGAIWLAETSSPATARTTAISTIRILERRMLWMMSTAVLLSCCCENPPPGAGMFASVGSLVGTPHADPGLRAVCWIRSRFYDGGGRREGRRVMLRGRKQQCEALDWLLAEVRAARSRALVVRC